MALQVAEVLGTAGENHATLAAAVELIHASLYLHYHVHEETGGRQGPDAALAGLGNAANVLLGDLFYTAAFRAIVDLKDHRIARILSDATTAIAEAEVLDLQTPACAECDAARYINNIRGKTGKLFEATAQCSAILSKADASTEQALAVYGLHLGTAYYVRQ
ncbi:polyprenyl synthetase family protein [Azohydromonas lata]|uniref:Polyprenyl synthetase family protein n=1 Tax=Azohydromonas lata TaxID=45677 RepID=A0ABU5INW5_9BURK|nr:polyprenyl synthetase family protein [Azohydromonas lata]MDZ5460601.1 polyprenyl synthetase family protein [Azohydromonas lata]